MGRACRRGLGAHGSYDPGSCDRLQDHQKAAGIVSESLNQLAKLEARLAYGFRNPVNQRRRVRIACTRGYQRRSRTGTPGKHIQ
jgi:hypothetical protein